LLSAWQANWKLFAQVATFRFKLGKELNTSVYNKCDKHVEVAIRDMATIATDHNARSRKKADAILAFSEKYLKHMKPEQDSEDNDEPQPDFEPHLELKRDTELGPTIAFLEMAAVLMVW
jgi:hypothetical protein